jgi:hypothetical protein
MPLITKTYTAPETTTRVVGFKCDRCKAEHEVDNFVEMQEYMRWVNTGGYGSIWGDGTTVEVIICQKCTHDLFKDFAITKGQHEPSL